MMESDAERWSALLSSWAEGKPEIAELWIFGSRARGDHRHDSDLDVAVVMAGKSKGVRFGNWLALANEWELELKEIISVPVDLDLGDADISTNVVAPALMREGVLIFRRSEKK